MTTHVICLDGTDQTKNQPCPTNIAHIFDTIGSTSQAADFGSFETRSATGQATGKYLPGVGSSGSNTLRVLGNLFGDGIAEGIIRGYTYLSRVWKHGDQIVLTGFSRGATAARALGGMIVKRGLLNPARYNPADKEGAYLRAVAAWYLYRHGQDDLANQARLELFRVVAGQVPQLADADFTGALPIAAIGVFDTVSSLGLPRLDWSGKAVFDFSICDTDLNPNVARGFHAIAADETRDLFTPTFWAGRADVVQHVFPGAHSDVGGGYAERGLSDCALDWMLANLASVANVFDRAHLGGTFAPHPLAVAHDDALKFPFILTPRRGRAIPKEASPSTALQHRWNQLTDILPGTQPDKYAAKARYADGSSLI